MVSVESTGASVSLVEAVGVLPLVEDSADDVVVTDDSAESDNDSGTEGTTAGVGARLGSAVKVAAWSPAENDFPARSAATAANQVAM